MKILIASGIFPPDIGGPATYAPVFAAECVRRRHQVRVIAYGNPSLPNSEPYPVSRIPRRVLPIRYISFFFACLFRGFEADVIFAQDAFSSGIPAAFAARILGKRLIVKIVGDSSWEYARNAGVTADTIGDFQKRRQNLFLIRMIRFFQWFVCRQGACIIVPSAYLKSIVAGWGIHPSKIEVVYNAVAVPPTSRGIERDPLLVFSAGRLVSWKGLDGLIRAFAKAASPFPGARLAIAGDGPCRAELLSCAEDAGIADRVSFLGILSPKDMERSYSRAGCFVLFSSYEGLSHVLLEALSHTLPVIASDAGGNGELIANGINGMLVPSGDEEALQSAISSFFAYPHVTIPRPGFTHADTFIWNALMEKTLLLLAP